MEEFSEGAFQNNLSLASLAIPPSVRKICPLVFAGCDNLKKFDFTKHKFVPELPHWNGFQQSTVYFPGRHILIPSSKSMYYKWASTPQWNTFNIVCDLETPDVDWYDEFVPVYHVVPGIIFGYGYNYGAQIKFIETIANEYDVYAIRYFKAGDSFDKVSYYAWVGGNWIELGDSEDDIPKPTPHQTPGMPPYWLPT